MKPKTSLWLSICTLVLCVGVMTFGVYSAINASLNITGTLGFNMHDCIVAVEGTIYNLAEVDTSTNVVSKIDKKIATTIMGGEATTTANISFGDMYFYYGAYTDETTGQTSSKVYDMIFELVFTNISDESIKISSSNLPTLGSGVTLIHGDTNANYTNLTNYSTRVSKGNSTTILFALNLADTSAVLNSVSFSWNTVSFESYKQVELVKYDSTNNYYYIEMGVNPFKNNEPLRWISFAYERDDGSYDFFNKTNEPQKGETYYFVSELVLRTTNSTSRGEGGVPFQCDYTVTSGTQAYVEGTTYQAQDYAVSNIRKFLKNEEAYTTCTNINNVVTHGSTTATLTSLGYNIVEIEAYNYITPRDLSELYEVGSKMTTTYNCGTEKDSLWLLSYNRNTNRGESGNLSDTNSEVNWVINNYGLSGVVADGGTSYAIWWLRSPHVGAESAWCVVPEFGAVDIDFVSGAQGVRPGFQITIP